MPDNTQETQEVKDELWLQNKSIELADLLDKKDALTDEAKAVQKVIDEVQEELLKHVEETAMSSWKIAGKTFYLNVSLNASAVKETEGTLFRRLARRGLGALVKKSVNAQTLAAETRRIAKEWEDDKKYDGELLPPWLRDLVKVYEKPSIRVRGRDSRKKGE